MGDESSGVDGQVMIIMKIFRGWRLVGDSAPGDALRSRLLGLRERHFYGYQEHKSSPVKEVARRNSF